MFGKRVNFKVSGPVGHTRTSRGQVASYKNALLCRGRQQPLLAVFQVM